MAYVYKHTRLDKNEIFYVGIGTKYINNKDYTRSKQVGKYRSHLWRVLFKQKENCWWICLEI